MEWQPLEPTSKNCPMQRIGKDWLCIRSPTENHIYCCMREFFRMLIGIRWHSFNEQGTSEHWPGKALLNIVALIIEWSLDGDIFYGGPKLPYFSDYVRAIRRRRYRYILSDGGAID